NKLEAENTKLQNQLDNTSNKKERAGLEQQIRDNENRIEELKMQIDAKEKEYDLAIKSGTNSDLGNASQIVDNPSNATSTNTIALSDTEKNSIANKVETNSLDANLAEVNKILDENNIGGPALNLFASDETTKNYTLQQWNDAIDNEIDRLNVLKMNATGTEKEKIEQEIQRYEDLREEKIKQFDVVTDPAKIDPVINPNDVVTDFTTRQNEINKITDEGERHKQNLALNEDLKDELLAEKANLQKILDENPGSKNIEERIANVDKLIVQTDQKIAEDKKWLAENQGTVVVDTDKVVAIVDPGYQAKVNEIYKTSDPTERGNQMQILNESFAEKSNERIQELEASIKSNPNDAVAKAELDELKRLNSQISTDATQPLVKPVVLDVASVTSKVSPDQLIPDYTDRKTDISKITDPYDKKTAENNLNKELSAEIRDEIKELEQLQKDNPGNTEITGRINNLKKLDDELNASIVANDKWLAANPKADAVVVDDSDVKLINPDYQEKVDAINSTGNPDEQKAAIKELNEETVEKIDDRIEELDKTLAQNPGDKSAQEEKEELMQMKNQIEQNPDKSLTDPTDFSAINTKPSISEIMPDYQDKMNGINGSSQTTIDKEKDKIELNSDLVSLINSEIESLTEAKTTHPEAAKNIDKRIAGLNEIKTLKENEIKVSQDKIGGSTGTSGTLTIKDVMPDYEQKIAAIDKKNLEEKAELTEKNGVNNELIGKIDSRIDQLEKEKTANPSNAAQIDQKIQSLEDIKSQKQAEINANNERIQQLDGGTSATRPALTISSVMPDYDQKMAAIEKKNLDEKTELTEKNTVNNQLITAIDFKIDQLETEKNL
ncbi:MAG: hypothetical protein JNJ99_02645, partial [Crocinitomicaceae bacterium]|nr:hypothetical protein [Crocinitomicaceae bacterium]